MKRYIALYILVFSFVSLQPALQASNVRVILVHGPIWPGQATFVEAQLSDAFKSGDSGAIVDLDSESGSADAVSSIMSSLSRHSAQFPIAVYVHTHATGPASAIAVASKLTAVDPSAIIGDAGGDTPAILLQSAAGASGRNPSIAAAFVRADSAIPSLNALPGDTVTLTAQQAQANGFAELIAPNYTPILVKMGLPNSSLTVEQIDPVVSFATWVAQGWVTIVLLVIGILLIIAEVMTLHSWGIGGIIGAFVILIILTAHVIAGLGTWIGLALFFAGIGLVVLESHVIPGHGISAIFGLGLIFFGFFLALGSSGTTGTYSIIASLLATFGTVLSFFLYLPKSKVWNKIGQPMRQSATTGYVSSEDFTGYIGHKGTAATVLRPAGSGDFSGVRLSVVAEDGFVAAGTTIQIVEVQGNRIVIKAIE